MMEVALDPGAMGDALIRTTTTAALGFHAMMKTADPCAMMKLVGLCSMMAVLWPMTAVVATWSAGHHRPRPLWCAAGAGALLHQVST
jgi:hypothetical protein